MWSIKLLEESNAIDHLSICGAEFLENAVSSMAADQDQRTAAGYPISQIPLLWRGLAETMGLVVDNAGRIIDGPRTRIPGL